MSKSKDDRLRALPTREQRAMRWFLEATERGDKMSAEDFAGMLAMFADFECENSQSDRITALEAQLAEERGRTNDFLRSMQDYKQVCKDRNDARRRVEDLEGQLADAVALLRELRDIPFVFNYIDDDAWLARYDALLNPEPKETA